MGFQGVRLKKFLFRMYTFKRNSLETQKVVLIFKILRFLRNFMKVCKEK